MINSVRFLLKTFLVDVKEIKKGLVVVRANNKKEAEDFVSNHWEDIKWDRVNVKLNVIEEPK